MRVKQKDASDMPTITVVGDYSSSPHCEFVTSAHFFGDLGPTL